MAGPLPQPGILEISPYVGGESKVPGIDKPARLASNENPLGPSPRAAEAYAQAAAELHRYPDGGALAIRTISRAPRYFLRRARDRAACRAGWPASRNGWCRDAVLPGSQ